MPWHFNQWGWRGKVAPAAERILKRPPAKNGKKKNNKQNWEKRQSCAKLNSVQNKVCPRWENLLIQLKLRWELWTCVKLLTSCCTRRILNNFPYFFGPFSSSFPFRKTQICLPVAAAAGAKRKWKVMGHLSRDPRISLSRPSRSSSSLCFRGFYFILLLHFSGSGSLPLTFAYQFVRIRSCCSSPRSPVMAFSYFPIPLHTFGSPC